ncbi:MAG: replicase [Bramycfau virus 6]|nr:MAG: replicase [Bramycfau virus 6]
MYQTDYGKLFVAPCGLGKTKFAPGILLEKSRKKNLIMLTERIKSAESAYDWYSRKPLAGISFYEIRAGGKTKQFGDKKKASMTIMTTNAWVDSKRKVKEEDLLILDEAHNITSGTIAIMNSVPSSNLIRVTATPPDQGIPMDFATPLPSKIEFASFSNWDVCEYWRQNKGCTLLIQATVNECLESLDYVKACLNVEAILATGDGIFKGKEKISLAQLEKISYTDCIIVATDVLQESVTLGVTRLWDCGRRVRPVTDVGKRMQEEDLFMVDWRPDQLVVPMTWPEVGQVAGRVGRVERSKNAIATINVSKDLDRIPFYVSEPRDKIERLPNQRFKPSDVRRLFKFKKELSLRCSQAGASKWDRMNDVALSYIDVKENMCDNLHYANALVQSMFKIDLKPVSDEQEVVEPEVQEDDGGSEIDAVNTTQYERIFKNRPVPKNIKSETAKPHMFLKPKNIKFSFGEIDVTEAKRIANSKRAGNYTQKQGYCYLQLVGYRKRKEAKQLGPNPRLDELARRFYLKHSKRLTFRSPCVAHVDDADVIHIGMQLAYLASIGKKCFVGCDDEEMIKILEGREEEDDDMYPEQGSCVCSPREIDYTTVGGDSDCWKTLFEANPPLRDKYPFLLEKDSCLTMEQFNHLRWMIFNPLPPVRGAHIAIQMTRKGHRLHLEDVGFFEDGPLPEGWQFCCNTGNCYSQELSRDRRSEHRKLSLLFRKGDYKAVADCFGINGETICECTEVGENGPGALTNAIKSVGPATQEAVDSALVNDILDEIGRMRQLCPFKIHTQNVPYFNTLGIPHYADAPATHSHPVHYAIRRNKVVNVIPKYITNDFTAINMKPDQLDELQRLSGKQGTSLTVLRDAKDFSRFGDQLADDPFDLPRITTPVVVLDQLAHYMSAGDIIRLGNKNPEILMFIAGHEFPVSSLFASASPLPSLWQHRVEGKTLFYKCEVDETHVYQQPFDPSLLLARTIRDEGSNSIWYCSVVHSQLNSHTQIISRIPIETNDWLPVQMHDFIEIMPVHRNRFKCDLVPRTLYDRMMDYCQTMPNLKYTERRAKMRQLLNPDQFWIDEDTKEELITVVETICYRSPIGRDSRDKYYDSFTGMIKYNTIDRVAKWAESQFSRKYVRRWKAIARAEHPLKLIPLVDLIGKKPSKGSLFKFDWSIDPKHSVAFWYTFRSVMQRYMHKAQYEALEKTKDWNIDGKRLTAQMSYLTLNEENRRKCDDDEFRDAWTDAVRKLYGVAPRVREPPDKVELQLSRVKRKDKDLPELPEERQETILSDPFSDGKAIEVSNFEYYDRSDTSDSSPESKLSDLSDFEMDSISVVIYKQKMAEEKKLKQKEVTPSIKSNSSKKTLSLREKKALAKAKKKPVDLMQDFQSVTACQELVIDYRKKEEKLEVKASDEVQKIVSIQPIAKGDLYDAVESNDNHEDEVQLFLKIVKLNEIDYAPIRNEKPWELWWDDTFPLSAGKRYNKNPYVPFRAVRDYPKEDCLLEAFQSLFQALTGRKISKAALWALCCKFLPKNDLEVLNEGLSILMFDGLCIHFLFNVAVHIEDKTVRRIGVDEGAVWKMIYKDRHWEPFSQRVPLTIMKDPKTPPKMPEADILVERLKGNPLINFKPFKPDTLCADKYLFHLIHKRVGTFHNAPVNDERLLAWDRAMKAAIKMEEKTPKERFIAVVTGDPGCGKSKPVADILKNPIFHKVGVFQVALPVGELRDDWAEKIGVRQKKGVAKRPTNQAMCCTFEYALAKTCSGHVLIVDEDKFPTGYIALITLIKPMIKYIVFLGDPFQGSWHDPGKAAGALNELPGEMERYQRYSDYFVIGSKRFGAEMGSIMCTPTCYEAVGGGIRFINKLPTTWLDLKPVFPGISDDMLKRWWNNQASLEASHAAVESSAINNRNEVMTMASSQGLTKDLVILHVNQTVLTWVGPDILWVALSRAQRVVIYWSLIDAGKIANLVLSNPTMSVLNHYRSVTPIGKRIKYESTKVIDFRKQQGGLNPNLKLVLAFPPGDCKNWNEVKHHFKEIHGYLDGAKFVPLGGTKLYRDIDHNDEGHQGHPYMALRTRGYRYAKIEDPKIPDVSIPIPKIRTKLVMGSESEYTEYVNQQVRDRFSREIWSNKLGYSIQAPEGWKMRRDWQRVLTENASFTVKKGLSLVKAKRVLMKEYAALPDALNPLKYDMSLVNWGLLQSNADEVSYAAMLVERVRRSTYEENKRELALETPYGDYLWTSFSDYCGWTKPEKFDPELFEKCDAIFTARRAARSEAMKKMGLARADPDFGPMIIAKTQFKLKSTDIKDASALQTTLTMDDEYLFKFGKIGVYMLEKLIDILPPYVYIHAKKRFADTAAFVEQYYEGPYWESDLKQQEQSMRGGYLHFFKRLMAHLAVPGEYIDALSEMKLNTKVGKMTLALMTASGEIFTWIYNTFGNGARIAAKYNLKKGMAMMLTGDDSLVNQDLKVRADWKFWEKFDHATEKSSFSEDRGTFAGYVIKKRMIFKNPELLLRKLMVANHMGKMKDVIHGYFLEWLTIYSLSDNLYDVLTDREMQAHNILSNKLFNARRLFKVNAKFGWDKSIGIDYTDPPDTTAYVGLFERPQLLDELMVPMTTEEYYMPDEDL